MDVVKRILRSEIREQFDLTPLHGVLLTSAKPGMGKTALMRAFARWLHELGQLHGFDLVLYVVKPNELKVVWHGGDAKLVREELCGAIRARQRKERTLPLFQFVVLDEVDSLGSRAGGDDSFGPTSSAHNDAVQALLAEMDGMDQQMLPPGTPPAHVVFCGLTNRPDLVDAARGMGLTEREVLLRIRLPLVIRTIMAGIRTATVISVGVATLAAFIGAGGLGEPIVTGLYLNDTRLILSGALPAAVLALVADVLLGLLERTLTPRGVR